MTDAEFLAFGWWCIRHCCRLRDAVASDHDDPLQHLCSAAEEAWEHARMKHATWRSPFLGPEERAFGEALLDQHRGIANVWARFAAWMVLDCTRRTVEQ
jgi:hypothetical protein